MEDRTLLFFHLWIITEVFSNADGTIQFIELSNSSNNEHFAQGETFTTNANTFTYPNNLPSSQTAGRTFLMATSGFAALPGAVTPDYVIPKNFFSVMGDRLSFDPGSDVVTFTNGQLPIDGVNSLLRNRTTATNSPKNFAGASGSINLSTPAATIMDNGDAGYTASGFHTIPDAIFPTPEGRGGDIDNSGSGVGTDVATWAFSGLTAGMYRVSATWSTHENRANDAPFSIFDGTDTGPLLRRTLVNQELAPADFTDDGSAWEDLGVVTITGNALTVRLSDEANGYVIADAVRIEPVSMTPAISVAADIDDGDAGYADTGWNVSPVLEGRLNDVRYQRAGDGSQTAAWTFTGLTPGTYTVAATWSEHANRATNAPFTMRNGAGGELLEIVHVNQELAPDDFTDNGSSWETLSVVTITGDTLVVQLSNDANGFVIADGVRIAPTMEAPLPPGVIVDDGDAGFSTTAGWTPTPITEGRGGDVQFAGLGDGSRIATWTFSGLAPGMYRVLATWSASPNRATNAPYTILDGMTSPGTATVNQQLAPADLNTLGSAWEDLLTVQLTGSTLIVELSNAANGFVIADAVRVQPVT